MHFHLLEDFFPRTFLYKIILEAEKKSKKIKSRIVRTLFKKDFFPTGHFQCEILGLFPGNFFPRTFFGGYQVFRFSF